MNENNFNVPTELDIEPEFWEWDQAERWEFLYEEFRILYLTSEPEWSDFQIAKQVLIDLRLVSSEYLTDETKFEHGCFIDIPDGYLAFSELDKWSTCYRQIYEPIKNLDPSVSDTIIRPQVVVILLRLPGVILSEQTIAEYAERDMGGTISDKTGFFEEIWNWISGKVQGMIDFMKEHIYSVIFIGLIVLVLVIVAIVNPTGLINTAKFILDIFSKIWDWVAKLKGIVWGWVETIMGWLGLPTIQKILQAVKLAHRIGLRVSTEYRTQFVEWTQGVRDLSKALFEDASMIHNGLTLLQLSVYDVSRLVGKPVDLAEIEYFEKADDVIGMIEKKLDVYRNTPSRFWFDLQKEFISPEYKLALKEQGKIGSRVAGTIDTIVSLDESLKDFEDRYKEYRRELDGILKPGVIRGIDKVFREYKGDFLEPFREVRELLEENVTIIREEQEEASHVAAQLEEKMNQVSKIVADPDSLTEADKKVQRKRITSILDRIAGAGSPSDRIRKESDRIESILDRL